MTENSPAAASCAPHSVDTFAQPPYLFRLSQNANLAQAKIKHNSPLSMPGQVGTADALQASPQGTPASAFTIGRRFAIGQNWTCSNALRFLYHGQKSGKPISVSLLSGAAPDPGPSGWKLAWSDEFNGPAGTPPDPANWGYDLGDGSNGWGNHELETYTNDPANAAMDGNGNLVITARPTDPKTAPSCYYGPCRYTSARILTQNKFELTHGRVEIRARVAPGAGLWSAFWALGTNIGKAGWPTCGEIDVLETVTRIPNRVYGTIHGPGYSGANGFGGWYDAANPLGDGFHVYDIEWSSSEIDWYIDGVKYKTAKPSDVAPNQWVYNHPFFLILNLAVGGDFGGEVPATTPFPASMAVDYIRVYSAPDTAQRFTAHFNDSFSGWKQITLPFKSFKRAAQQPDGAPTTKLNLKDMWGYTVDVPDGMQTPVYLANVHTVKLAHAE